LYQNLILRVKKGTVEKTVDKMEYGSFVYRCFMARKKASTPCVMQLFQLVVLLYLIRDISVRSVGARSGCLEVESGYRKWKCAFDKSNGFARHEMSTAHILHVKENRETSSLVDEKQLFKNRYYDTVIFDVIKFLASNELSFRVDDESYSVYSSETCSSFRLFLRLVEFTLVKDTHLQELIKYTSKVAIYKSPEIQNEVVAIIATENFVKKLQVNADVVTLGSTMAPKFNLEIHLQELIKYTWKVAIYKSPEIQNEVVAIIATENFVKKLQVNADVVTLGSTYTWKVAIYKSPEIQNEVVAIIATALECWTGSALHYFIVLRRCVCDGI
ncbi:hypothetical protein T12_3195, partial [Trichinella patagoniensis]